jgi:hypothetical protein
MDRGNKGPLGWSLGLGLYSVVSAVLALMLLVLPAALSNGGLSEEASPRASSDLALTSSEHPEEFTALPMTDHVELSWRLPSSVGAFYIFRSNNLNSRWADSSTSNGIAIMTDDQGNYSDYDVEPEGMYVYFLEPFSTYLSDQRMVELGGGVPDLSRELRAETSPHVINLTWWVPYDEGGTGVKEFRILKRTDSGPYQPLATVNRSSGDWDSKIGTTWLNYNLYEYVDMDVSSGHQYYYQISAVNDIGEGAAALIGPIAPRPSPVISLVKPLVDSCKTDVIQLNWTLESTSERVVSFRIYYYPEIEIWWYDPTTFHENYLKSTMVKEVSYPANSTTVELNADMGVAFRISAVYSDGAEAYSELAGTSVGWCEGVYADYTPCIAGVVALLIVAVLALVAFGKPKSPKP